MFQKLLPILLLPLGILGLVYLAKYALLPRSTEVMYFPLYYLVLGTIVLCLLMIQHFTDRQNIVRLMLGILGTASLLFIAALLHERAISTRYYRIGFSVSDKLPLHEIAINGLLALYFFVAVFSSKNITAKLRTVTAIITVILFFPVIGFYNYAYFERENITRPRNDLTEFIHERNRNSDSTPRPEYLYRYYPLENQPPENIDRIIETTEYEAVLVKVDLDLNAIPAISIPRKARCRYRAFLFSMTPDGKSLKISDETDGQIVMLDFYTRLKTDSAESEKISDETPFIYEDRKIKIIIKYASYYENRSARVTFDAYIKKTPVMPQR